MKTKPVKFTSKLGTSKGTPRSRIWLQGARLVAAGFLPGTKYTAIWNVSKRSLTLLTGAKASDNPNAGEDRIVSGKGDVPIIDIVGAKVAAFGAYGDHVDVTFDHHEITIRPAKN